MAKPTAGLRGQFAGFGADDVGATVLHRDAGGHEAVTRQSGECLLEMCAPAELFEFSGARLQSGSGVRFSGQAGTSSVRENKGTRAAPARAEDLTQSGARLQSG